MCKPTFRRAVAHDLAAVDALFRCAIDSMCAQGIDQWDAVYPATADFADDIASGTLHLMEYKDQLLAVGVLNCVEEPEWADAASWQYRPDRVCALHRLCVHPQRQSRGIGQRMLSYLELVARAQGFDVIRLDAFLQNLHAIRFYERMGYRHAGNVRFRKGMFGCYEKAL